MKSRHHAFRPLLTAGLLLANAAGAFAATLYVDVNSANATPPYTNWATAATNIQDAVDAAVAGDEVVVMNGIYATGGRAMCGTMTNRVAVEKPLAVRSVNGPQITIIQGYQVPTSIHGDGTGDGAIRCVYLTNGASLSGFTLTNGATLAMSDSPTNRESSGGGLWCESTSSVVISNCVISGNSALTFGGGAYLGTLNNCILAANHSGAYGGGAAYCTLNNCILTGNQVDWAGGGAYNSTLSNCTLAGNRMRTSGGWLGSGATFASLLRNCINFNNYSAYLTGFVCEDCDWDPRFIDLAGGNLRLQSNSPCINAGNNVYTPAGPDLDGNLRVVGGTVDIGAYEFQAPVSQISYAWLQRYGLPINASTDTADPDGDAVDNYHEWLAGTNPTNALSSPAQLAITPSGVPPSGIILTWSTNAVGFTLQSTTNLLSPAAWVTNSPPPIVANGQNTVTNPITSPQQFYRLIH